MSSKNKNINFRQKKKLFICALLTRIYRLRPFSSSNSEFGMGKSPSFDDEFIFFAKASLFA